MGMGDLDDAIREHLELKRKHGASDEEVTLEEREAQKQGALPTDPGAMPAEQVSQDVPDASAGLAEPELETPEVPAVDPAAPPAPLPDEVEPDEVLPEEALELDVPPAEAEEGAGPAPDWSTRDLPEDSEDQSEDVLEETPDFLEEMPEQDRLWFEQRPPKDFDFDD
jgi:hypothetical protein